MTVCRMEMSDLANQIVPPLSTPETNTNFHRWEMALRLQ